MATPVDIIGGFYTVGGRSWAAQDCVNYLPMAAEVSGTKTQTMLRTPPGLRPWVKVGDGPGFAIRGMHDVEGALFVVSGSRLYQISNKGVAIPLGTIPGVGRVSMAHNQIAGGNQLLVVNGNSGYVWNTLTQTFERVTDEGYPGASVAQFVNSYLMQLEPFGRFLFFSDLADATAYNTLDRFEAEAQPDPVVSILTDQNEVVAFGTRTMQFFENTGAAQGTFQSKGVVISRGCAGRFTPVKIDNSLAWLGDDGVFYRLDGYSPRRISTHAIEEAIAGLDWSQAFGMVWTDQGHTVAYWTFPDGQTWGFDVSSGLWHRRASYHPFHEVSRRWRPSALVRSNGKWIAGDATSGKLFVMDWDYMLEDVDQPLVSERVTQIAVNNGSRFSVDAVDLWMRTGEKPSATADFPLQPIGPKITGDAPNARADLGYLYQYMVTAGDSSQLVVTAKGLPEGWAISPGGLLAGPVGPPQTISATIRVTDGNGLWDEIQDTIELYGMALFASSSSSGVDQLSTTYDGQDWISLGEQSGERCVASDGTSLVAVSAANAKRRLASGGSWITSSLPSGVAAVLQVIHAKSRFIAVGRSTSPPTGKILTSSDGASWAATNTLFNVHAAASFKNKIYASGFYAIVHVSEDGILFEQAPGSIAGSDENVYGFATDGKSLVAIGDGGLVAKTTDGNTWTPVATPLAGAQIYAGAFGNGRWVFVENDGLGRVMAGANVDTLALTGAAIGLGTRRVVFARGKFYAIGGDVVRSSVDGAVWMEAEGYGIFSRYDACAVPEIIG